MKRRPRGSSRWSYVDARGRFVSRRARAHGFATQHAARLCARRRGVASRAHEYRVEAVSFEQATAAPGAAETEEAMATGTMADLYMDDDGARSGVSPPAQSECVRLARCGGPSDIINEEFAERGEAGVPADETRTRVEIAAEAVLAAARLFAERDAEFTRLFSGSDLRHPAADGAYEGIVAAREGMETAARALRDAELATVVR